MLESLRAQVGLLATMQALVLTNNVTLVAITGLAGFQLADDKLMATLPVTGYVLGGAVWAMPAAAFMRRFGRRAGYSLGSVAGMAGAFGAAAALRAFRAATPDADTHLPESLRDWARTVE